MSALTLQPVSIREARAFVLAHHRHHPPPQGARFAVGVARDGELVGVALVGNPVARHNDDGWTAEVTRLCVLEGVPNACSKLYAAAWRAARALGYRRIGTYLLASEPGTSVRAAGWRELYQVKGRSWDRPKRGRVDQHPTEDKGYWLAGIA